MWSYVSSQMNLCYKWRISTQAAASHHLWNPNQFLHQLPLAPFYFLRLINGWKCETNKRMQDLKPGLGKSKKFKTNEFMRLMERVCSKRPREEGCVYEDARWSGKLWAAFHRVDVSEGLRDIAC